MQLMIPMLEILKPISNGHQMLRAGIELGRFRMGAEYNFIPPSNLQDTSGAVIGEAINQYFGFTFGFYVGGGRWRKS